MQTTAANIKKKDYLKYKNEVCQVMVTEFYHPGKGRTVMRTKLKNLKTGKTVGVVYTSNETVELVEVSAIPCQFLYTTNKIANFMHEHTFEQYEVSESLIGKVSELFKEGQSLFLLLIDNKPIGIRSPKRIELQVISTEDAIKGNTATNAKKIAKLETGANVSVPLFIKNKDKIAINPETLEYIERVK